MIDAIIRWSLTRRWIVLGLASLLLVWGGLRAQEMPLDVFPDLTAPTVTVISEAHSMAPEEVERLITFPLETAFNGASSVRRVRSASSIGTSVVWIEFAWGTDIYQARQIITEKLQLVQTQLPPQIDAPVMTPISSIMGEILFIGLSAETTSAQDLRTIADWRLRRRLLAVPGVSQVIAIGGGLRQFQVEVNPSKLAQYELELSDVIDAVKKGNANSSAGFLEQGGQEHLIYGMGRAQDIKDVSQIVVEARGSGVIRVKDLAKVILGDAFKRGDAAVNGRPAVILGIQKQPGVNTLKLTQTIELTLDQLQKTLPKDVKIHRKLLRQADFVQASISNVTTAMFEGSFLVILIVGLFLWSLRATLITALAIPLSLLVSLLVIDLWGGSLNTMTLGGMAIAVGALVDDAIIDVENVVRRLKQSQSYGPREVLKIVFEASKEIRSSIVFATAIIVLVFLPLFFLQGVEGRLLQPLGVAYVISLAASLLVALTVTPVLCAWLLPNSKLVKTGHETKLLTKLKEFYRPLLSRSLDQWPVLLSVSLVGSLLAVGILLSSGRSFLPKFNEGALTISVVSLPGTALAQSNQLGKQVESILLQQPEVVSTARRTGRAELDEHAQSINASEIDVRLKMAERSREELLTALRDDLSSVAGANIVIGQPLSHRIDHLLSGTRANIAIKVFGPNLEKLSSKARRIETILKQIDGVVDLAIEQQGRQPLLTIKLDRPALAKYGLRAADVLETIETAYYGQFAGKILEKDKAFDILVRYPAQARESLEAIKQTMISNGRGAWIPLEALAEIRKDLGPNQISRENGQRKMVVMANVGAGKSLSELVETIQEQLAQQLPTEEGYYVEYGGQFEAANQAGRTLLWLSLAVIVGIFGLLVVALDSPKDAFLVMANLPLALIGGSLGVLASGGVISVASLVGFITLFGIATRNGIMMVGHIRHLQRVEGLEDLREAVLQGASERLAPILMTALASGLGLLPLALAQGLPGAEIQAPMALVILCGLLSSTLLNMVVVPAAVFRFSASA